MKNFISVISVALILVSCGNKVAQSTEQVTDDSAQKQEVQKAATVYENNYLVKVGDIAPDFTLSLTDGTSFTLSQNRGKVVMLQFTASWCGVCRKEMPFIERDIWLPNKDNKDFVLVGIDREEPLEDVKKFAETTGVTYPLALDSNADVFHGFLDSCS